MLGMGVTPAFSELYSVRVVTKTPFFPKVFVIAVNRDAIVVSC